jgi:hypothetical protein
MLGEGSRELGILIAVFLPLDNVFEVQPLPFWIAYGTAVILGGGFFAFGIYLERSRPLEES